MPCTIARTFIKVNREGREMSRDTRYLQRADQSQAYGPIETAHLYESREAAAGIVTLQEGQRLVDVHDGRVIE